MATYRFVVLFSLLASLTFGCNLGATRPGATADAEQQALAESQHAEVPPPLSKSEWVIRAGQQDADPPLPKWRHAGLEELLEMPADSRPGLVSLLENQDPLVQANTAIALARLGQGEPSNLVPVLSDTVTKPIKKLSVAQRMAIRRAAVEALGSVRGVESRESLHQLLETYGDHQGANRAKYQSELHAELLRAMQVSGADLSESEGLLALTSSDRNVRLQALRVWPTDVGHFVPEEIVTLCEDLDPELRGAALQLLAQSQHPEALATIRRALGDSELAVRLDAIQALGLLGGEPAMELLKNSLDKKQSERIRTAAVAALAGMGSRQVAFTAVDAEDWQVRRAIAETLAEDPSGGAPEVARQLLNDPSQQVTGVLLASVANWPLVDAVPLLLDAMESDQFATRKAATETLAERWPAARQFSFQAPSDVRAEVLAELRERWQKDAQAQTRPREEPAITAPRPVRQGARDEIANYLKMLESPHPSAQLRQGYHKSLVAMGDDLIAELEDYALERRLHVADEVYTQVLPEIDAAFAELVRLQSDDKIDRRRAAAAISARVRSGGFSRLALLRLAEVIIGQDDPLIWRTVQEVVTDEEDAAIVTMQTAGLTHPSAEVRRRAFDYFAQHPDAVPIDAMFAALDDPDNSVVHAALKAIGAQGSTENALPIVRLTASNDKAIRVAAAVTLVQLGLREGADALRRLALDADADIRRIAAQSMGETRDGQFLPVLIGMLDDQLGVRRAALASLTEIVGEDIGRGENPVEPNTDEQIHRWRKWHLLRGVE